MLEINVNQSYWKLEKKKIKKSLKQRMNENRVFKKNSISIRNNIRKSD